MSDFDNCSRCGSPEQETMLDHNGECVPCAHLREAEDGDDLPQSVLLKLVNMAQSRHPSVCNEDAVNFANVLEEEGYIPEKP